MVFSPNELQVSRIGVVAGRAVGKAVKRNRAKRLVRNAVLPYLESISAGWDILLIARSPLSEAAYLQVKEAIRSLLRRSSLFVETDEFNIR